MPRINKHRLFLALLFCALIVSYIPYVSWPLSWMETYFHEISHGLAGLLSGGQVSHYQLRWDGAGRCYVAGGWQGMVAFAGYFGAVVWGAVIYIMAVQPREVYAQIIAATLGIFILLTMLLWARDGTTLLISLVILSVFWLAFKFSKNLPVARILQFVGLSVLLGATEAPILLLGGDESGDSAILARLTYTPQLAWVLVWVTIALWAIYILWRNTLQVK